MSRRCLSRSKTTEKERAKILLGDFVVKGSKGLQFIENFFDSELKVISLHSMQSFAKIFSELIKKQLPRDIQRKKSLLVKWFDDHYEECLKNRNLVNLEFKIVERDDD